MAARTNAGSGRRDGEGGMGKEEWGGRSGEGGTGT